MHKGTIKTVISDKGFGFITEPGNPQDVFFHHSSLPKGMTLHELTIGDTVTFEIETGPRGVNARNITFEK